MEDKDFIRQISDTAKSWDAPYEEGAWEEFNRERNRRRGIIGWRYAGAAAALLFLLLGGLWIKLETGKEQASQKIAVSPKIHQSVASETHEAYPSIANGTDSVNSVTVVPQHPSQTNDFTPKSLTAVNNNNQPATFPAITKTNRTDTAPLPTTVKSNIASPIAVVSAQRQDSSSNMLARNGQVPSSERPAYRQNIVGIVPMYDSLAHHTTKEPQQAAKKFNYAVAVNPAVGNKRVSVGAGLEVAYSLNDRFSVGSGLGFTSLHAQADGNDAVVASRQLQGTDLAVNGVEVPLNLRYQTGGGFYINAGISAVAVVSNQMAYHYLAQIPQSFAATSGSGAPYQALRTVTTATTEQTKESLARYIGFYTFSVGKRQAIGKKQINWGPFIKVPFNPVSSQDIRLTQGGFRLSFDF